MTMMSWNTINIQWFSCLDLSIWLVCHLIQKCTQCTHILSWSICANAGPSESCTVYEHQYRCFFIFISNFTVMYIQLNTFHKSWQIRNDVRGACVPNGFLVCVHVNCLRLINAIVLFIAFYYYIQSYLLFIVSFVQFSISFCIKMHIQIYTWLNS